MLPSSSLLLSRHQTPRILIPASQSYLMILSHHLQHQHPLLDRSPHRHPTWSNYLHVQYVWREWTIRLVFLPFCASTSSTATVSKNGVEAAVQSVDTPTPPSPSPPQTLPPTLKTPKTLPLAAAKPPSVASAIQQTISGSASSAAT